MIECMYLGQSGIRLNFNGKIIYIDPYLSNSVKKIEGIKDIRYIDPLKIRLIRKLKNDKQTLTGTLNNIINKDFHKHIYKEKMLLSKSFMAG